MSKVLARKPARLPLSKTRGVNVFRIGVDTGGTFTDAVGRHEDGTWQVKKLPTTAERPAQAILHAVDLLLPAPNQALEMVHGTTHATNALLTGRLGKVAFLTTQGFRDLLAIGRQDRDSVYALEPNATRPAQPVARIVEVAERCGAGGEVVQALTQAEIRRVVQAVTAMKPEAIAIA